MDFYVFLPSNASPDIYPDNKTSEFKIQLSKRMELLGQWQAALIELHYPNTIENVTHGENIITISYRRSSRSYAVRPGCYQKISDLLNAIHEAVAFFNDFSNEISEGKIMEETPDHRICIKPFASGEEAVTYTFSPRLALQLGLDSPGPFSAMKQVMGSKRIDLSLGVPAQMYLYMDILADQIIGHTRAPILRTVPVNINATYGTMSIFHCEHPIYFDLSTRSFDTLEIDIRDHTGRFVSFDYGTSTLLVHFKQLL